MSDVITVTPYKQVVNLNSHRLSSHQYDKMTNQVSYQPLCHSHFWLKMQANLDGFNSLYFC